MKFNQIMILILSISLSTTVSAHGDLHDQIESITEKLEKDPKNAELLMKRGSLYSDHDDHVSARKDFDRVAELEPNSIKLNYLRARDYFATNDLKQAKSASDSYLAKSPGDLAAIKLRAHILARMGLDAEADFEKALSLEPEPDLYIERAQALMDRGAHDAAVAVLKEGLVKLGSLVSLQSLLVDIETSRRHYEQALAHVDSILTLLQRKESWLVRRALLLEKMGRKGEARKTYIEARDEIARLPERHRKTQNVRELEKQIEERLSIKASVAKSKGMPT